MVGRRLVVLLTLVLSLQGCYFLRLYAGQRALQAGTRPVDAVLQEGALTPEEQAKLRFIQEVRAYAEETLGLRKTGNFTIYYDTGDKPVSWNVTACRRDRFESFRWHFPILGATRYKGFFDRGAAEAEKDALLAKDYEAHVLPVAAYSTLGYFKDPVYSHHLKRSYASLADLIIHELVHSHLYVAGNTAYNESLASFVAAEGGARFVEERFGGDSGEFREFLKRLQTRTRFAERMTVIHGSLDALYRTGAPREEVLHRREKLFSLLRQEYDGEGRNARWDNAFILLDRTYHRTGFWKRVFEATGGDWGEFFALARGAGRSRDPFRELERLTAR